MGEAESLSAGGFDEVAAQLLARCERDCVHADVEALPGLCQGRERQFQRLVGGYIALVAEMAAKRGGKAANPLFEALVLEQERELRPFPVHRPGYSPGDGSLARHSCYQGPAFRREIPFAGRGSGYRELVEGASPVSGAGGATCRVCPG